MHQFGIQAVFQGNPGLELDDEAATLSRGFQHA
jgi:hypothetical protein